MYLLQSTPGENAFYFFVAILSLVIFYFIIRGAVASGTKEVRNQLRLQNKLKVREMRKLGYSDEEIMEDIKAVNR